MRPRLLFIGLDAADADLIERWALEGCLPNISRLKSEGSWARLRTTAEIFHVSAWPSIFTGTTADKHGLYHAYVVRPGHQGLVRPRPDETPFPFLWKLLNDHGKRSTVIDAFLTCPLRPFDGAQIVDWGSWSHFWDPTIVPASLEREIRRTFGSYPAEDHSKVGAVPLSDLAGFRKRLLAGVSKKTALVRWLMQKDAWDFFLVVYGEAHPAGHYFWHLWDETYLTHPRLDVTGLRDALRDVYVALDGAIGALIDAAGRNTAVMLVSGDGMAANYSGSHLLPNLLTRMGVLNGGADAAGASSAGARTGTPRRDLLSRARNLVPENVRNAISQALLSRRMQEQLSLRWKTAGIAWPRTRAFVIENANEGYIRVNLKGREPEGVVLPGAEYAMLCDEIARTARATIARETGRPAALAVHKTDDICRGPRRGHMPDIVITWDPAAKITTELVSQTYGLIQVDRPNCLMAPYYTGNHWPNAFAAMAGPQVARGAALTGHSVLDLAPTILAYFGIDPPEFMDGRVLSEWAGGLVQASMDGDHSPSNAPRGRQ